MDKPESIFTSLREQQAFADKHIPLASEYFKEQIKAISTLCDMLEIRVRVKVTYKPRHKGG